MNKQAGMSLSEVLVSLFLSSIIFASLMQFYCNSKDHYLKAEKILAEELDLKWVSELLSDSIRRAGFTPCIGLDQLAVIDTRPHTPSIHGLKIEMSSPQIIQINRMSEYFSKVVSVQNTRHLITSDPVLVHKKHPLLIADCDHAEIHQIDSMVPHAEGFLIILKKPLQFNYSASTYVGEYIEEQWFIKKNIEGGSGLYYRSFQTEELTPLVKSLEIHHQRRVDRSLIEVVLGLANGSYRKISILVRGI